MMSVASSLPESLGMQAAGLHATAFHGLLALFLAQVSRFLMPFHELLLLLVQLYGLACRHDIAFLLFVGVALCCFAGISSGARC